MKILDTCHVSNASNGTGHWVEDVSKKLWNKKSIACAVKCVLVVGGWDGLDSATRQTPVVGGWDGLDKVWKS